MQPVQILPGQLHAVFQKPLCLLHSLYVIGGKACLLHHLLYLRRKLLPVKGLRLFCQITTASGIVITLRLSARIYGTGMLCQIQIIQSRLHTVFYQILHGSVTGRLQLRPLDRGRDYGIHIFLCCRHVRLLKLFCKL